VNALPAGLANDLCRDPENPDLQDWWQEAVRTVRHPDFAELFDPRYYLEAMNEVPVQYLEKGQLIYGIIDRVVIQDDAVRVIDYKTHPYHQELIKKGLRLFVENQILQYEGVKKLPIHFVGSIAYFIRQEIAEILKEFNLTLGVIERHPIRGLIKNHFKIT